VLHYLFASPNASDRNVLNSIEALDDACEDFFDVALSSRKELEILFSLLRIESFVEEELPTSEDFSSLIDFSHCKLPEFSKQEFDEFYELWLSKTGRESNMDEYGQLIFVQGQAQKWNSRPCKVVLCEKP
jgi:hypothetical protein